MRDPSTICPEIFRNLCRNLGWPPAFRNKEAELESPNRRSPAARLASNRTLPAASLTRRAGFQRDAERRLRGSTPQRLAGRIGSPCTCEVLRSPRDVTLLAGMGGLSSWR